MKQDSENETGKSDFDPMDLIDEPIPNVYGPIPPEIDEPTAVIYDPMPSNDLFPKEWDVILEEEEDKKSLFSLLFGKNRKEE